MDETEPPPDVELLLAEFLAQDELDFETWVRSYSELEPEIRSAWADYRHALAELEETATGTVAADADDSAQEYLRTLADFAPKRPRYEVGDEFARGAMGAIKRATDRPLGRELAMKVALRATGDGDGVIGSLGRFVEEAQITGQLEHPGIVPVHDLGVDAEGQPYFTMRLVRGRNLSEIYELARAGRDGWNTTRVLGVLLKVCEAMAYAHSKGVIHRDLKPANVMVGRFGEVYVMDWGLAKLLGRAHARETGWDATETIPVMTDVRGQGSKSSPTALITLQGAVMGTPAYMPIEQASGHTELVDKRSDVYAMGAMLYQLLVGRPPYVPKEGKITPSTLLIRLLDGPPDPIEREVEGVAPELVAICEKAMSRERDARYDDMAALAEDLRAFQEGRVVTAHESGALAELRKWVVRNRAAAVATGLTLASLLVGLVASWGRSDTALTERAVVDVLGPVQDRLIDRSNSVDEETHDLAARAHRHWGTVPFCRATYALSLFRKGALDEAATIARTVAELDPETDDASRALSMAILALALDRSGRGPEARRWFERSEALASVVDREPVWRLVEEARERLSGH